MNREKVTITQPPATAPPKSTGPFAKGQVSLAGAVARGCVIVTFSMLMSEILGWNFTHEQRESHNHTKGVIRVRLTGIEIGSGPN